MSKSDYKQVLTRARAKASSEYERLAMQGRAWTGYAMVLEIRLEAIDNELSKIEEEAL